MNREVIYFLREMAGEIPYEQRKFKGHAWIAEEAQRLLKTLARELLDKEINR